MPNGRGHESTILICIPCSNSHLQVLWTKHLFWIHSHAAQYFLFLRTWSSFDPAMQWFCTLREMGFKDRDMFEMEYTNWQRQELTGYDVVATCCAILQMKICTFALPQWTRYLGITGVSCYTNTPTHCFKVPILPFGKQYVVYMFTCQLRDC